jgi:hypothetical protein
MHPNLDWALCLLRACYPSQCRARRLVWLIALCLARVAAAVFADWRD